MNYQQKWISGLINFVFLSLVSITALYARSSTPKLIPYLGWNSYDCYGSHVNEKLVHENLDAFIEKLKPYGYEYFVLDAGWFRHYDCRFPDNLLI